MNGHHAFPIFKGEFFQLVHNLYASIGNEDVNVAPSFGHLGNAAVDSSFLSHIHRQGHGLPAGGKGLGSGLCGFKIKIGYGDLCASGHKAGGDGFTYAGSGPGDDGSFAV